MAPRGVPDGLDDDTSRRILRTFLVVRLVRGSLLLLFLALALAGVEANGWPIPVAIVVTVAMLAQAGALVVWGRRWATAGRGAPAGGDS